MMPLGKTESQVQSLDRIKLNKQLLSKPIVEVSKDESVNKKMDEELAHIYGYL